MTRPHYDLCVIGGGINGAGIARDAAGRGLSVLLVEKDDLAAHTSSASTKLIHGGLRYLEYYEFGLVREALRERETLMAMAPHIIWPLSFVLPHNKNLRPAWMIRLGLCLYDHLTRLKTLPASKSINLHRHDYGTPLLETFEKGFVYADCWVEDSRLVVLNALDAQERGADIRPRTECAGLKAENGKWSIVLHDKITGKTSHASAARVVNAAGPWVRHLLDDNNLSGPDTPQTRAVKGSHIIVRRLYEGEQAYILQQADQRIVFAIPYEQHYTLIGTTEEHVDQGDLQTLNKPHISDGEILYLCEAINHAFKAQITHDDVIWSYSGVRPLIEDKATNDTAATRGYRLVMDDHDGAPLLSVFGGKITTYRHLAEDAVDKLTHAPAWTKGAPLPGGDIAGGDFDSFYKEKVTQHPDLPPQLLARYAQAYGTRMDMIIQDAQTAGDLGQHFGDDLYEAEIRYLMEHEWAITNEDILYRRSKQGLHVAPKTVHNLENFLKQEGHML